VLAPRTLHHGASGAARLARGEGVKYRTSFGSDGCDVGWDCSHSAGVR